MMVIMPPPPPPFSPGSVVGSQPSNNGLKVQGFMNFNSSSYSPKISVVLPVVLLKVIHYIYRTSLCVQVLCTQWTLFAPIPQLVIFSPKLMSPLDILIRPLPMHMTTQMLPHMRVKATVRYLTIKDCGAVMYHLKGSKLFLFLSWCQRWGSVTFWYGSGSSDQYL